MDHSLKTQLMDFETFSNKVLFEIVHTGGHTAIKEELYDHYLCLVDDYVATGISPNQAQEKAILSLGNPKAIGKSLNNVWFPELKYNVQWLVVTGLYFTAIAASTFGDFSFFNLFASFMYAASLGLSLLAQGTLVKYLITYFRKGELPFVRVYSPPKRSNTQVSYVERLTNRVFIGIGVVFGALMPLALVMGYFEGEAFDSRYFFICCAVPLMIYQLFITFKMQKTPILIVDGRGIWLQNGTLPVLPWGKIEDLSFGYNHKKEYSCTVKRTNKSTLRFNCLPMDRDIIYGFFKP